MFFCSKYIWFGRTNWNIINEHTRHTVCKLQMNDEKTNMPIGFELS